MEKKVIILGETGKVVKEEFIIFAKTEWTKMLLAYGGAGDSSNQPNRSP